MLGQAFGVQSRMDFERKARRRQKSFQSPISAPNTSYSSTPRRGRLSKNSLYENATPTKHRKSRVRSESTSSDTCLHHYHCNCTLHPDRCHYEPPKATSSISRPTPTKSKLSTPAKSFIPVPSPRRPPTWNLQRPSTPGNTNNQVPPMWYPSTPGTANYQVPPTWNFQPPSTPGMANNQVPPPMNFPTGPQGQAAQFGPYNNIPAWTPPPQFMAAPNPPVSPAFPGYRSSSMPVFNQTQPSAAPYQETNPPAHAMPGATFFPPPPPPPPTSLRPQGSASSFRYSPNEAKKFEEHYKTSLGRTAEEKREEKCQDKAKGEQDDYFSKHLKHRHFCAACGALRSKAYHQKHPLEKGQLPEPDYCHKCVVAARKRDDRKVAEEAVGSSSRAHDYPQGIGQDPMLGTKVDADYAGPSNKTEHTKNSRSRDWIRKARRLSILSNFLPSSTATGGFTQPSMTVASSESEYIPSAPIPVLAAGSDRVERPASPGGQTVPSFTATVDKFPAAAEVPKHAQDGLANKYQGSVPEKVVQAKTSSSLGKPEKQKQRMAQQVQQQTGSSNTLYNQTRIPSVTKTPKRPSKIPRPANSKPSSEVSKAPAATKAPEPSEAARMYHKSQYDDTGPSESTRTSRRSQYKPPTVTDKDEDVVFPAIPAKSPKKVETPLSHVRWGKSRVEEPSSETEQYKDGRKNTQSRERWTRPSPMVPRTARTQQVPKFPDLKQKRSDDSPTRKHRDGAAGRQKDREAHLRFADEVPSGSTKERGYSDGWDWTSKQDPFNPNPGPIPAFSDDFWGTKKDQAKPQADASARPDPASTSKPSASKPFDNSTNSATGFSRIVPSFLSHSEISVESYGSNRGPGYEGTPSATYRLDELSDTDGETVEGRRNRPFKKLGKPSPGFILGYLLAKCLCPKLTASAEYSSKDDRDRKTARTRTRHRNKTSSTNDLSSQARSQRSQSNSAPKSSSKGKNKSQRMYYPAAEDLENPRYSSPLALESSTIAHTGHSAENLSGEDKPENNSPTETGRRRRVRRPSQK